MRLLVVEDDPALSRQLADRLESAGYAVDIADNGEDGQFQGETEPYDAIVLDLGLPRVDGLSVLRAWRARGIATPVIILTARGAWTEKVQGIDAGADDYLAKPFSMEELLARIRALIRRSKGHASAEIACGGVVLDTRSGRVTVDGQPVDLTAHEYRVLAYLMHRTGQVVSRSELTEHIYAQDFDRDSNTIEVFIGRLRRKLGVDVIKTVRGLGYKVDPP
ncbi:response regulator transcription factor [Azospirillum canadense]|uniref:response regulator transcription factor n=1 Tax=Azospirillum canadense TaxID=403962 RepID=UPI002225F177|nr:response regulator transcription factor [Azospirillum canadense]MCW2244331.1 two-component system OmpR family response regulator [Azospirillum canadense]